MKAYVVAPDPVPAVRYVGRLIHHVVEYAARWLTLCAFTTIVLGAGILWLELRIDGAALRPQNAAAVVLTEADRLRFEEPRQVILLVSARATGEPVATPAGFRFLKSIRAELRALPGVRASGILSLAGLPKPHNLNGEFVLDTFLESVPDDPVEFDSLLADARTHHLTEGLLLSPDGRHAALYIPLVENRSVLSVISEIEEWVAHHAQSPFELKLTGPEVAEATLGRMVLRDLLVLVPVMLIVIITLLWVAVGNVGGVVVPMAESLLVLVWTFGAMGWMGVPVTLVTTILPVVLMAIAITDEIHVLERVQALMPETPALSDRSMLDRRNTGLAPHLVPMEPLVPSRAVEKALVEMAWPLAAAAATTALGFLSFSTASIAPVRQFGLFAAFGILAAMVLSFLWVPAMVTVLPARWFASHVPRRDWLRGERVFPRWCLRNPTVAMTVGVVLIATVTPGMFRLRVQDSWVDNFAPETPLVRAEHEYNASFWGSYRFDVVLEGAPNFFYSAAGAALVDDVERLAADAPYITGVLSYRKVLAGVSRALGGSEELPTFATADVADLASIVEMSEMRLQLRQLLTDAGDAARVRLFVRDADYERTSVLTQHLDRVLPPVLSRVNEEVSYHVSGDLPIALTVVDAVVRNQLSSIAWTLPTVAITVLFLFRRVADMLICLVPVVASIILILGGMGYAGMPLGIATSMFASLAVGVGVDFAIHVLERYRLERRSGSDHELALSATFEKTGRGIAWNAIVLAGGFLVLNLSGLKPNHSLGILLASAMVVCYAATFMLLPRILCFVVPGLALLFTGVVRLPTAQAADESRCHNFRSDSAAAELMQKLETDTRAHAGIVRMHIETRYVESHPMYERTKLRPIEKVLWGVSNGDSLETRILYTFSAPGWLAGTTLLLQDFADPKKEDVTWFYLRSFERFTRIDARRQSIEVPGTALTYEDSRGFVSTSRYAFSFTTPPDISIGTAEVIVLACPIDSQVRQDLGYDFLLITVDEEKKIVRRVDYADLSGKPLKSYQLLRAVEIDGVSSPAEIRTEHYADGYVALLTYERWPLRVAPPAELYVPDVTQEKFLPRLERLLAEAGLGARIRKETEAAGAQVREQAPHSDATHDKAK